MVFNRKAFGISVMLSVVLIIATISTVSDKSKSVSVMADNKPQIILDAGHGGLTNTTH